MQLPKYDKNKIKVIVGLGNPGPKYYKTRHSIGFRVVDALADYLNASWRSKQDSEVASVNIDDREVLVLKPQTFMNASGRALLFIREKGIKPDEVLVIHDELERPFGDLTFKFAGSAKGHNGLRSIIDSISLDFWRLRFGICRPEDSDSVSDYVLTNFTPDQEPLIADLIQKAVKMILA